MHKNLPSDVPAERQLRQRPQPLPLHLPRLYAGANRIGHPTSFYLREDRVLELLDPWLGRAFTPANLTTTIQAMANAQHDDADEQAIKAERSQVDHVLDCVRGGT